MVYIITCLRAIHLSMKEYTSRLLDSTTSGSFRSPFFSLPCHNAFLFLFFFFLKFPHLTRPKSISRYFLGVLKFFINEQMCAIAFKVKQNGKREIPYFTRAWLLLLANIYYRVYQLLVNLLFFPKTLLKA